MKIRVKKWGEIRVKKKVDVVEMKMRIKIKN